MLTSMQVTVLFDLHPRFHSCSYTVLIVSQRKRRAPFVPRLKDQVPGSWAKRVSVIGAWQMLNWTAHGIVHLAYIPLAPHLSMLSDSACALRRSNPEIFHIASGVLPCFSCWVSLWFPCPLPLFLSLSIFRFSSLVVFRRAPAPETKKMRLVSPCMKLYFGCVFAKIPSFPPFLGGPTSLPKSLTCWSLRFWAPLCKDWGSKAELEYTMEEWAEEGRAAAPPTERIPVAFPRLDRPATTPPLCMAGGFTEGTVALWACKGFCCRCCFQMYVAGRHWCCWCRRRGAAPNAVHFQAAPWIKWDPALRFAPATLIRHLLQSGKKHIRVIRMNSYLCWRTGIRFTKRNILLVVGLCHAKQQDAFYTVAGREVGPPLAAVVPKPGTTIEEVGLWHRLFLQALQHAGFRRAGFQHAWLSYLFTSWKYLSGHTFMENADSIDPIGPDRAK